ncbi:exonuclease domain-containing protein [Salipaludibacillus daqingensis]|uniref:exonuclease domain-containing protein n=1 Tax=Salipaludibacillus daqingensis TaxID=3041001 RepID=UPI00247612C7|nr:exonuclease domain-containing protein [Salipaludibacillus daqingensis]
MNPMGQWIKQLSGMVSSNHYTDVISERDPAKVAYMRRLQKSIKQQDHLHIPFSDLTVVVFDIETTGFYPQKGDRILSIGATKVTGKNVSTEKSFYSLIKSTDPISDEVQKITGITSKELQDAPPAEEVLIDFFKYINKHTLVAHHANHEKQFMQNITWTLFKTRFDHRILDTSFLTKLIDPMKDLVTLEDCCAHYGIDSTNRHHALSDAEMTAKMWSHSVEEVEKQGFTCLKDVYAHLANIR